MLALLAARLLAYVKPGGEESVIGDRTTLYRSLVDLTCGGAGNVTEIAQQQYRLSGHKLRDLLRRTAAAMTSQGQENISYTELELRLDVPGRSLSRTVDDATRDNILSQLMISYYFKGGHTDLGCEFLHKSFREYLFAEAIVETLKEYGRRARGALQQREPYWREFDDDDPRRHLTRDLAPLLAPQWLSREVIRFVEDLIEWELSRAAGHAEEAPPSSQPTPLLPLGQWESVRDALADVWDWWCEGVHLRPQPVLSARKGTEFETTFAQQVIERGLPLDLKPRETPVPWRTTTVDGHLGDALFRLTVLVHFHLARATGWLDTGDGNIDPRLLWDRPEVCGKRQVVVRRGERLWVLFAPSLQPEYWPNYVARINATGWRPAGAFPESCDMRGIYFRHIFHPFCANSDLSFANLTRMNGSRGYFVGSRFDSTVLDQAFFESAEFVGVSLAGARAFDTDWDHANLAMASFSDAHLTDNSFRGAWLQNTSFRQARLDRCQFGDTPLEHADFTNATGAPTIPKKGRR